jgi:hypothetical protein
VASAAPRCIRCGTTQPSEGWALVLDGGEAASEATVEWERERTDPAFELRETSGGGYAYVRPSQHTAPPPLMGTGAPAPMPTLTPSAAMSYSGEYTRTSVTSRGASDPYFPAKLVGAFGVSFAATAALVLGMWVGLSAGREGAPPAPAQPVQIAPAPTAIVAEPARGPEPEPIAPEPVEEPAAAVPAPAAPPVRPAAASIEPDPEPAVAEAPPATVERPEPAAEEPETVERPEVAVASPKVERPAEPAATAAAAAAPAASRTVPPEASALSGLYLGKSIGKPISMNLQFQPEGSLRAVVKVRDGETTVSAVAEGTYSVGADGVATIALMETSGDEPNVYSGTVGANVCEGRVTTGGRNRGKFRVER